MSSADFKLQSAGSKPKCKLLQFTPLLLRKGFGSLLMDGSLNHLRATVRLACCIFVLQKNGKDNAVGSFQLLARLMHPQQLSCTSNICIWGYLHWECWAWGSLKAACKQDQRVELTVRTGSCFKATCSIWDPSSCSVCDPMHCLALLQFHQPAPPRAVKTQNEGPQPGGRKSRGAGCERYLELIGFLDDDLEFGVLPQHWAPHLCDPALLLLLAGQRLLFFILLCKAKSPWVNQAQLVTLDLASWQRGRSQG